MPTNTLPKQFLDCRNEGPGGRERKGGEGYVGCLETAVEGGGVVGLGKGDVLGLDFVEPEVGGLLGLGYTEGG